MLFGDSSPLFALPTKERDYHKRKFGNSFYKKKTYYKLRRDQTSIPSHCTDWFIHILIIAYYNPCVTGWHFNPLCTAQNHQGSFYCSIGFWNFKFLFGEILRDSSAKRYRILKTTHDSQNLCKIYKSCLWKRFPSLSLKKTLGFHKKTPVTHLVFHASFTPFRFYRFHTKQLLRWCSSAERAISRCFLKAVEHHRWHQRERGGSENIAWTARVIYMRFFFAMSQM